MLKDEKAGLKRHESLIVFSHEHHHGLVFCKRLKKTGNVEKEIIQDFARDFWDKYLKKHFEEEEAQFLQILEDKTIKEKFIADHLAIQYLFWKIESPCGDKREQAMELSDTLNEHIRFEERVMFPYMEETAEKKISVINVQATGTVEAHQYSPEFWKDEN
jgi:hypothetical protein